MSFIAEGQVQTTKQPLYTIAHRKGVRLEMVNFFNDNAATQILILYLKRKGGTSRKLRRYCLDQDQAGAYLSRGETLSLSSGDELEAETTTANAVDYVITGVLL